MEKQSLRDLGYAEGWNAAMESYAKPLAESIEDYFLADLQKNLAYKIKARGRMEQALVKFKWSRRYKTDG